MKLCVILVAALMLAAAVSAAPVTSLPGLNTPLLSAVDSGYITVDPVNNRKIFYMFVESQRNPAKDPVVLWLTGGPGCSGLIAAFNENGAFSMNFTANGYGIQANPYSWSTVANMIYIESPAGVGFSFSDVESDYVTGDNRTAHDTYNFLVGFFKQFPQFATNDFWVTGESYGGHYVPEIVTLIMDMNAAGGNPIIRLKGMQAGNPWTDPPVEAYGVVDNWWQRAMISESVYSNIYKYCDWRDITFWIINNVTVGAAPGARRQFDMARLRAYAAERERAGFTSVGKCFDALIEGSLHQFGAVNILGVYLDVCNNGTRGDIPDQPNYCADNQLVVYLNLPAVQAALHVDPQHAPAGGWGECSNTVNHGYSSEDTQTSMIPRYQRILASGLKVLIYSGDNDAIVPTTGTRRWIRTLQSQGLEIVNDVHEWFVNTNGPQVGGWAVQFSNMTFTTIRGGGHMAPYTQPARALYSFSTFLAEGKL